FLFALLVTINLTYAIGFAFGLAISGIGFGVFSAACAVFIGLPLALWFLGNSVRHGAIGGETTILRIPLVGWLYERVFAPETYYAIDTALMFQQAVHNAVLEVIDCMTA